MYPIKFKKCENYKKKGYWYDKSLSCTPLENRLQVYFFNSSKKYFFHDRHHSRSTRKSYQQNWWQILFSHYFEAYSYPIQVHSFMRLICWESLHLNYCHIWCFMVLFAYYYEEAILYSSSLLLVSYLFHSSWVNSSVWFLWFLVPCWQETYFPIADRGRRKFRVHYLVRDVLWDNLKQSWFDYVILLL